MIFGERRLERNFQSTIDSFSLQQYRTHRTLNPRLRFYTMIIIAVFWTRHKISLFLFEPPMSGLGRCLVLADPRSLTHMPQHRATRCLPQIRDISFKATTPPCPVSGSPHYGHEGGYELYPRRIRRTCRTSLF